MDTLSLSWTLRDRSIVFGNFSWNMLRCWCWKSGHIYRACLYKSVHVDKGDCWQVCTLLCAILVTHCFFFFKLNCYGTSLFLCTWLSVEFHVDYPLHLDGSEDHDLHFAWENLDGLTSDLRPDQQKCVNMCEWGLTQLFRTECHFFYAENYCPRSAELDLLGKK